MKREDVTGHTADYAAARRFPMPFGKYVGMTLEQIGDEEWGLGYLDWLVGELRPTSLAGTMIATYLEHPDVSRRLDLEIGEKD